MPPLLHANWAGLVCPLWWSMPGYPQQVAELADALLRRPLSVPLDAWEQIVGGNGADWLER